MKKTEGQERQICFRSTLRSTPETKDFAFFFTGLSKLSFF